MTRDKLSACPISRPYHVEEIPPYEEMAKLAPRSVLVARLRPTQPMLRLDRLLALLDGEQAEGPDPHPHVIGYDGELWVHNGHTRWVAAMIRGRRLISVRLWEAPRQACDRTGRTYVRVKVEE